MHNQHSLNIFDTPERSLYRFNSLFFNQATIALIDINLSLCTLILMASSCARNASSIRESTGRHAPSQPTVLQTRQGFPKIDLKADRLVIYICRHALPIVFSIRCIHNRIRHISIFFNPPLVPGPSPLRPPRPTTFYPPPHLKTPYPST